ncbi:MAG: SAM-dependent methyltransferase [Bacteroidia bacterium]|nr:SAM-dependent methyltransferase [Bacteroidia bacterium]
MQFPGFERTSSSFRDPDGFILKKEGIYHRFLPSTYLPIYQLLVESGLYQQLTSEGLLIKHEETDRFNNGLLITPEQIPFISYPYEWSFQQLKDAALLTLNIQYKAIEKGLSLKDASAYNVQFIGSNPVFIDTSSFEPFEQQLPWKAYGQFCQHFLSPLVLMAKKDLRLGNLLSTYIEGIPLDLTVKLLPFSSRFNFGLLTHLYWHAKAITQFQHKHTAVKNNPKINSFSKQKHLHFIQHLLGVINSLAPVKQKTVWDDYYQNHNYTNTSISFKKAWIQSCIARIKSPIKFAWDMGANDGTFSMIPAEKGIYTIAMDFDRNAVNEHCKKLNQLAKPYISNLLPLVIDVLNPSAGIGWNNEEKSGIFLRGKPDLIMAMALIHHLVQGINLSFDKLAAFFYEHTQTYLLIEFIGEDDSQWKKLNMNRGNLFNWYNEENFKTAFLKHFDIVNVTPIPDSARTLYMFRRK